MCALRAACGPKSLLNRTIDGAFLTGIPGIHKLASLEWAVAQVGLVPPAVSLKLGGFPGGTL